MKLLDSYRFIHSLPRLVTWLAVTLLLLGACNRNQETPTPTPPISQDGPVGSATQQAPANGQVAPSAASEAAPHPTAAPLTGRVVLWHSWAQTEGDALAGILEAFKGSHPDIQIDTLFVAPDDLVVSYAAAVSAGSGPDLVLAPNWWLGELVAANSVLNLDSFISGDLDTVYWPAAVASMRHNNSLYGFPLTYNLVALYVNNNLVPPGGIPTGTDAMLAAAQADPTSGVGLYATLFHTQWGFPAYGSQLFNNNGLVTLDQSNGAADYLTWLNTLNSTPGSYVNSDYGMLLDRFKKGEFAYLVDGPWALDDLRTALGDALSVAPLPNGPAGPAQPWLYSDGLFVNPTLSPQQQTIALTVAFAFSNDQAGTLLATVGGLLPAARNVDLSSTPLLQGFAAQAATAVAMPTTPEMNNVWTYGGDMIIKALAGTAEPPVIVAETTTLINEANNK
jgi:arabinogalactan oligomer/maltooligosaccharide transport system substrate-binding protein